MSILQEYEEIRAKIGEEKYFSIDCFLDNNPQYYLSDVYYNEEKSKLCDKWIDDNKDLVNKHLKLNGLLEDNVLTKNEFFAKGNNTLAFCEERKELLIKQLADLTPENEPDQFEREMVEWKLKSQLIENDKRLDDLEKRYVACYQNIYNKQDKIHEIGKIEDVVNQLHNEYGLEFYKIEMINPDSFGSFIEGDIKMNDLLDECYNQYIEKFENKEKGLSKLSMKQEKVKDSQPGKSEEKQSKVEGR